jgi:hypothetical protein
MEILTVEEDAEEERSSDNVFESSSLPRALTASTGPSLPKAPPEIVHAKDASNLHHASDTEVASHLRPG